MRKEVNIYVIKRICVGYLLLAKIMSSNSRFPEYLVTKVSTLSGVLGNKMNINRSRPDIIMILEKKSGSSLGPLIIE